MMTTGKRMANSITALPRLSERKHHFEARCVIKPTEKHLRTRYCLTSSVMSRRKNMRYKWQATRLAPSISNPFSTMAALC